MNPEIDETSLNTGIALAMEAAGLDQLTITREHAAALEGKELVAAGKNDATRWVLREAQ